jgi:hypothetical protein
MAVRQGAYRLFKQFSLNSEQFFRSLTSPKVRVRYPLFSRGVFHQVGIMGDFGDSRHKFRVSRLFCTPRLERFSFMFTTWVKLIG